MRASKANDRPSLPDILRTRAADSPGRTFLDDLDGQPISYGEFHREGLRWASAFENLGIESQENVVTLLPNCPDAALAWVGLAWLRAVEVPVNPALTGRLLADILNGSSAETVITVSHLAERMSDVAEQLTQIRQIVVLDRVDLDASPFRVVSRSEFFATASAAPRADAPQPHDIASIIYTSGTTGRSKGVMVPWGQLHATAVGSWPENTFTTEDAFYSPLPLYHVSGKNAIYLMALVGGRVVMRARFSTARFIDDVVRTGSTTTLLLGAMTTFLQARKPHASDAAIPLRNVLVAPVPADVTTFAARYGVRVCTGFSMTEISSPLASLGWNLENTSSCGRVRPGYDVRVVDAFDEQVGPDEIGELIVRADAPWSLMCGYWGMPSETVEAWRNQWFHTGDLFRYDTDGYFYFVDRAKDAIRRRGENISSFEVEREVLDHPSVAECAAVAVASEWGEDEVKVFVVFCEDVFLDPSTLHAYLLDRMPRFMVPRFIEPVNQLPKTQTQKVRKAALRKRANSASTWDAQAAETLP